MRKLFAAALLALLGTVVGAAAQNFPARPITLVVPFPAGGSTDTLARIVSERMRVALGQPVIIENVGGASGSLGVGRVARSPADGYTLSIGTLSTHCITAQSFRCRSTCSTILRRSPNSLWNPS